MVVRYRLFYSVVKFRLKLNKDKLLKTTPDSSGYPGEALKQGHVPEYERIAGPKLNQVTMPAYKPAFLSLQLITFAPYL